MQRCEEVASLQSQVSQEKELRTVMEGCLMEDKMAWRRVHAELVENHRLAQDMNATLAEFRACRGKLFSCLTTDEKNGDAGSKGELRGGLLDICFFLLSCSKQMDLILLTAKEGLTHSSIVELMKKLDSHEEELGKMFEGCVTKLVLSRQWRLMSNVCWSHHHSRNTADGSAESEATKRS